MSYSRLAPVRPPGRSVGARSSSGAVTLKTSPLRRALAKNSPLRQLDWVLLLTILALCTIGTLLVWSSSPKSYLVKQAINIPIGLILLGLVTMLDYRQLRLLAPVLYGLSIIGLIAALTPLGTPVNGSKSWITLPAGFQIEPSEYAKLAVIIVSATLLSDVRRSDTRPQLRAALLTIACAALPLLLIVKEPDLGVTVLMVILLFGMIALSGIKLRWLTLLVGGSAFGVWAVIHLHLLKAYQASRITSFLNPTANPQGAGYNAAQAKLAVGSGGLFGQGLFHGQLVGGNFIPEQNTDFIFAVAGEELGFIGAIVIIALIAVLLLRALRIAARADDQFGMLVAAGIAIWFAVQTFINVGMTIGIMPVTGLPLPFVSYGGSSLFADMIAMGVLQTVHRHHTVFT
jgi:rod shape determining protein RodA